MGRVWTLLVVIATLGAGAWGIGVYVESRPFVRTENAYVGGDIVTVSAQIEGTIVAVSAEEGDYVAAGQVVVQLGRENPGNRLQQRQDELALAVQKIVALKQRVRQYEARVSQYQAALELAQDESQRRQRLGARGMVSEEERRAALLRVEEATSALESARQALAEARITAGAMPVDEHPRVQRAATRVRQAFIDMRRTQVVAPAAGHVAKRFVSAGMRTEPGRPLLQIVQLDRVWVEANFKETQLRHLRIGQPVEMTSDLYGDEVRYHGTIDGTGTGTGSVFALLPAQNATGNWLKVIQRVPVRITLSDRSIDQHALPLGTSMRVHVDTRERSGARLKATPRSGAVSATDVYAYQTAGIDDFVRQVIADNLAIQPAGARARAQSRAGAAASPLPHRAVRREPADHQTYHADRRGAGG